MAFDRIRHALAPNRVATTGRQGAPQGQCFNRKTSALLAFCLGVSTVFFSLSSTAEDAPSSPTLASVSAASDENLPPLRAEAGWADRVFAPDSRPEICLYDATDVVGLHSEPFSVRIVTAPETLNREQYVPLSEPFGNKPTIESLCLRWTAILPDAAQGDRPEMMVLHVQRDDPSIPLKAVFSHQSPVGVVFKQFEFWKNPPREVYHSYREDEGDGERVLNWVLGRTVLEEQLPLLVRSAEFQEGRRYGLRIAGRELSDRCNPPQAFNAELTCSRPASRVTVPAGEFPPHRVRQFQLLRADGMTAAYLVAEGSTNLLLEWETNDGRSLRLREIKHP